MFLDILLNNFYLISMLLELLPYVIAWRNWWPGTNPVYLGISPELTTFFIHIVKNKPMVDFNYFLKSQPQLLLYISILFDNYNMLYYISWFISYIICSPTLVFWKLSDLSSVTNMISTANSLSAIILKL